MEHREYVNRIKDDFGGFSRDVQQIFVDSSVEVIDSVRELVGRLFDDLKSLVDIAANRTQSVGERANDYVRRNPWKAAVGFVLLSVAIGAVTRHDKRGQG